MARVKKTDADATRRRQIEKLYDEGLAFLENEEFAEALEIAGRLRALRWSGGFEIEARAHVGRGDLPRAIATLERAVEGARCVAELAAARELSLGR